MRVLILSCLLLTGCVSKTSYDKVVSENERLLGAIEDLNDQLDMVPKTSKSETPLSHEVSLVQNKEGIVPAVEASEIQEDASEQVIWGVEYYKDEFGYDTKEGYVKNRRPINGLFTNVGTANSKLNVDFIIKRYDDISIQLFEYGDKSPVRAYSRKKYEIFTQDSEGDRLKFEAYNNSDRIKLNKESSKLLHSALLKGGTIQFVIKADVKSKSKYFFTIEDADLYGNVYHELSQR